MVLGILKKSLPLLLQGLSFPWKKRKRARSLRRMGGNMNEVAMPHGVEPREILQTITEGKSPAIMSYLSGGKWQVAKVSLTKLGANRLDVLVLPGTKARPINIQVEQPVGISLKYGYGKFIFETKVIGLEPSPEETGGGTIALAVPDRIEVIQRRSYFRVAVPRSLKVNVLLWHRCRAADGKQMPPSHYGQGRLVDISAGGAQVAIAPAAGPQAAGPQAAGPRFRKGQFVGLRFTPMPYEMPLMFDAQIRSVLPTVDRNNICLGLQIVGLEASPEGHEVLQRLCSVVERYYQISRSGAKQQDFRRITDVV